MRGSGFHLTAEETRLFKEQGYIVRPNVLSAREVDLLRRALTPAELRQDRQPLARHKIDALWRQLVRHARVAGPVGELFGGVPCVVQSMIAFKPRARPGRQARNGIALHQDQQYIKTKPAGVIGCWVALDHTDAGNGGFMVVPASHCKGLLTSRSREGRHFQSHSVVQHMRDCDGKEWHETADTFEIPGVNWDNAIALNIPKGGAVYFDGFLVHGSRSNTAEDRDRLAVAIHFVKQGTWVYRVDLNDVFPVRRTVRELRRRGNGAPRSAGRHRPNDRGERANRRKAGTRRRYSSS